MSEKRRILGSFSMGATSGFMTKLLLDQYGNDPNVELVFVTANTTQEDRRSLAFGSACNGAFNAGIALVEAVINPTPGKATTHQAVSWSGARFDGAPFEQMIAKYGIPNKSYPHCNRELKIRPIHHYVQNVLGWEPGSYDTAIGIRADEIDRISMNAQKDRIIYPLVRAGVTKRDVGRFWSRQTFRLNLPAEYRGNCLTCWKMSLRKHLTLMAEEPSAYDFNQRMEATYPFAGANKEMQPRRFFRQNWTTLDLRARAKLPFEPWIDGKTFEDPDLDLSNGCEESCDITPGVVAEQADLFGEVE